MLYTDLFWSFWSFCFSVNPNTLILWTFKLQRLDRGALAWVVGHFFFVVLNVWSNYPQIETCENLLGLRERSVVTVDWNSDETMIRWLSAGSHRDWSMSMLSDWWRSWWWSWECPAGRLQLPYTVAMVSLCVPRTSMKLVLVRTIGGRLC